MRLRTRRKKVELDQQKQQQAHQGASFIRYEIIEKRGQKKLVPVRYSIRNEEQALNASSAALVQSLHKQILNDEVQIEEEPSAMESMFTLDETSKQIRDLINLKRVEKGDIEEVLDLNQDYSLVRLRPEVREKFGGREHIAAALKRLSSSPRREIAQSGILQEWRKSDNSLNEMVFLEATDEAVEFIYGQKMNQ